MPSTRDSATPSVPERSNGIQVPDPRKAPRTVDLVGRDVAEHLRDVQDAFVEDGHVVCHRRRVAARLNLLAGDELVHVVEPLVVAAVGHDRSIRCQVDVGGFVLEATKCAVLERDRLRIPGIDLHDVAEPVDLVRRLGGVEPRVEGLPLALAGLELDAVSLPAVGLDRRRRLGAFGRSEVGVEVLLSGQHGAPRRDPAGAVVERSRHGATGRISGGLDEFATRGRPGEGERRIAGDATVVAAHHRFESLRGAFHFDDRQPVRGKCGLVLVAGGLLLVVAGEHEPLGGVFVVDDK